MTTGASKPTDMSGLEVVGIVASIIQLADLGTKLSVKLCSFYRTVKTANQSLQGLSSDVSLTCSILNEFGKVLEQDDQTKICSQQAFCTAQEVLVECKAVFQQIEAALEKYDHEKDSETNLLRRGARRISAVFTKPDLDVLKSNLERLKTTTLLMLHVIMYAGDLRKQKTKSDLADQHDLIQDLIEERKTSQHKIRYPNESFISVTLDNTPDSGNVFSQEVKAQKQPAGLPDELREYYNLIQKLLQDVNAYKHILEQSRHSRIRTSIVNSHLTEVDLLSKVHGRMLKQLFDDPFFKLSEARMHEGHEPVVCRSCDGYGINYGVRKDVRRAGRPDKGMGRSRSRSRSHSHNRSRCLSHSRAKTLIDLDLGPSSVAAGVAAVRNNKSNSNERDKRSRSRSRPRSRTRSRLRSHSPFRGRDFRASRSQDKDERNEGKSPEHMAHTGLAGAAVRHLAERKGQCSRSRSRSRSHGLRRHTMPVLAAGAGTAAAAGFYEKKTKGQIGDGDTDPPDRRRASGSSTSSRSRSRGRFAEVPHVDVSFRSKGNLHADGTSVSESGSLTDDPDTSIPYIIRHSRASPKRSPTPEHFSVVDSATLKLDMDTLLSKTSFMDEALGNTTILKNLVLEWTTLTREEISEE